MSERISSERLLSSVLEGLDDPAILVEPSRRILASNRAFRDRFSPGKDPRGSFCYELTHGRSSPCHQQDVGSCPLEARGVDSIFHQHTPCQGLVYEEVFVHPVEGSSGSITAYLLVTHPLTCSVQLVGRSHAFTRMMGKVHQVAASRCPVLLHGETGSGKTCVARALHDASARTAAPFVIAGCAATSERELAEELFGLESLTSAGRRKGLIESAAGGTLLLRGVGDLPQSLAPKIAAVIQEGSFRRIGGTAEIALDVRWILSGGGPRDFEWIGSAIAAERISVPPLRNRSEDLELLIERMIGKFGEGRIRGISLDALALIKSHSFPGNIRELENVMERACMLADGETLLIDHFPGLNGTIH